MSLASSWLDLVIGVDIHLHVVPAAPPMPIPQPFVGLVGDPAGAAVSAAAGVILDLAKSGQFSPPKGLVLVNGFPATTTNDSATNTPLLPHLPMPPGIAHTKKPEGDASLFLGSLPVKFGGGNAIRLGELAFSCSDPGRLPTSVVVTIPKGAPVLVGGPPGVNPLDALSSWMLGKIIRRTWSAAGGLVKRLARLTGPRLRNLVAKTRCTVTGHPIDVATGRVFTDMVDFSLPGPLPLTFERTYFSSWSHRNGPLGPGWSHSLDLAIWREHDLLVFRNGEGQEITFEVGKRGLEPGQEVFEPLTLHKLERGRDGWRVVTPEGLVHRFAVVAGETDPRDGYARVVRTTTRHPAVGFSYDYGPQGRLATVTDSGGRVVKLVHDDSGRLTRVLLPHPDEAGAWQVHAEYSYTNGVLTDVRDALGQVTRYAYDGRLMVKETDRNGVTFYWIYDGRGSTARCVRTWGVAGDQVIFNQKLDYDPEQRSTLVTDSYDAKTLYRMNEAGAIVEVFDALGGKAVRVYDDNLALLAETDPTGQVTRHEYEPRGQRTATVHPDGSREAWEYHPRFPELVTQHRTEAGGSWWYEHDGHGQLIERRSPEPDVCERYGWQAGLLATIETPGGGRTEVLERDHAGTATRLRLPNGGLVTRAFDRRGRLLFVEDPLGARRTFRHDELDRLIEIREPDGNVRHLRYDPEGNVTEVRDGLRRIRHRYGHFNKLLAREEGGDEGTAGATVRFVWGAEGELREVRNEKDHDYRFVYDPCLRVEREIGFDQQETRYRRDLAGHVVRVDKPAIGSKLAIGRDARGRATKLTYADGTEATFAYREDGALLEARNASATVRFERDRLGRVVKEVQGDVEVLSFHAHGERVRLQSSLGAAMMIGRDGLGAPTTFTLGGQNQTWGTPVDLSYDLSGQEIRRALPGGLVSTWRRDPSGRPVQHALTRDGSGAADWTRDYQWALDDRLTALTDSRFGASAFQHDERGRLVAERTDDTVLHRSFDEVGNIYRTADRSDRRYVRGGLLRRAGDTSFAFDAAGNLVSRIEPGDRRWSYAWDGAGFLKEVRRPDGVVVRFAYDALGRRVSKRVLTESGERETRWIWDGDVMLHELRPDEPTTTWYHEPDAFAPLARVQGGCTWYVVTDHLGTPTALHESGTARAAWQMQLDVFGIPRWGDRAGEETGLCPFRWPGQYADAETGLYYNRFRYYDPGLGAYVSQDPIGLEGGSALYSYVFDPLLWLDPDGLAKQRALWQLTPGGTDAKITVRGRTYYRHSTTGFWWSPDTAGHGASAGHEASAFKVFQKQGTKLVWFRDADRYGDFIDPLKKHKSDMGKKVCG